MTIIKKSFHILNWKLLLVIFATLLIPALYEVSKTYFVGEIKSSYAFSIAGNLNWINVLFEVCEEAFLLPLFFTLQKMLKAKRANQLIIGKLYFVSGLYLLVIITTAILARQLLLFMSVNEINNEVITFVRIELGARLFLMISKAISIFLIAKNKWRQLIIFLLLKTVLNIGLDFFIAGDNNLSARAGIEWIALNQLIAATITTLVGIGIIGHIYKFRARDFRSPRLFFGVPTWRQNLWIGAESFVRNAFFIWFVLKTINTLPDTYSQGDFWIMNNFIWNWLLVLPLALAQYVNRDQAFRSHNHSMSERLVAPLLLMTTIIGLWFITVPGWEWFIKTIMNNNNYRLIAKLALISSGFYVVFSYNNLIDHLFLGSGNAKLLFAQSLFTNVVVYIPFYYFGTINNLTDIALMIGSAILVDSVLTFVMFYFYMRKERVSPKLRVT